MQAQSSSSPHLSPSERTEAMKLALLTIMKPPYRDAFVERFKLLAPIVAEVYTLNLDEHKCEVYLAGGNAAYLIGRFQSFTDLDSFVVSRQTLKETAEEVEKELRNFLLGQAEEGVHQHPYVAGYAEEAFLLQTYRSRLANGKRLDVQLIVQSVFRPFAILQCSVHSLLPQAD